MNDNFIYTRFKKAYFVKNLAKILDMPLHEESLELYSIL